MRGAVEGAEQVIHARLGLGAIPVGGCDFFHGLLAAANDQLAAVDERLELGHHSRIHHMGIVVVGGAGKDFQVERTLALLELQLVDDRLALQHAGAVVVEGDVVVEVLGVADQAVIGNDLDAFFLRLLEHIGHGRAIDRRDNQPLDALDHHVLDLR
ncbi:hypothetical protein D3C73_1127870 [compost metagenome]